MTDGQPRPRRRRGAGGPGAGMPGSGGRAAGQDGGDLAVLLGQVARGDEAAFGAVYDQVAGQVFGIVRSVVRDPAQSEEVTQEVLLDVWRDASRFDAGRGTRDGLGDDAGPPAGGRPGPVRAGLSGTGAACRPARRSTTTWWPRPSPRGWTRERVRRCLGSLTELQRESVTLAYYDGYTYREVAALLGVAVGTVKTRMRDGLIRLRDCLGVGRRCAGRLRRTDPHTLAGAYALDALGARRPGPVRAPPRRLRVVPPGNPAGCARPPPGWPPRWPPSRRTGCASGCWPPPRGPGSSPPVTGPRPPGPPAWRPAAPVGAGRPPAGPLRRRAGVRRAGVPHAAAAQPGPGPQPGDRGRAERAGRDHDDGAGQPPGGSPPWSCRTRTGRSSSPRPGCPRCRPRSATSCG